MTPKSGTEAATSGAAISSRSWPAPPGHSRDTRNRDTLVHRLHQRALQCTREPALAFADANAGIVELTASELDNRSRAVASSLQALGAAGQRAVLIIPAGLDYVSAFLGCLYANVIPVPTYPPHGKRGLPQIGNVATDADARFAITTRSLRNELCARDDLAPALASAYWLTVEDLLAGYADDWQEPVLSDDSLAFLQYTSGSTAAPRGVMVSHGNLRHNFRMLSELLGYCPDTRMMVWLPLYHDMGLIGGTLGVLYAGGQTTLMAPEAFLQRPIRWLQAVTERKANTTGAPNFAFDLCVRKAEPEAIEDLDLSGLELIFCGAEPVWPGTLDRFARTFAPYGFKREALYPCYGLAEGTLIVTGCHRNTPPQNYSVSRTGIERNLVDGVDIGPDSLELVGCGHSPEGLDVRIVDPDSGVESPSGRIGEIWVSGPSVAKGYWNRPDATEAVFHAHLSDTGAGPFLRTGDLGFFKGSMLFIAGRLKDLIIINGRNHHPHDIEATVMGAHEFIRPGGCAAFSVPGDPEEQLVIVVELDRRVADDVEPAPDTGQFDEVISAVRRAVALSHDLSPHRVALARPGSIPRTSSGKTQRVASRAKYVDGSLGVICEG